MGRSNSDSVYHDGGDDSRLWNPPRREHYPVNHVDIAPTTLGLCGIDPPPWMEGTDYSGFRLPNRQVGVRQDSAYLQIPIPTGHHDSIDRPWRGLVTRDGWKYVTLPHQPWLMFNLSDDPYEMVDLAHNTLYRHERKYCTNACYNGALIQRIGFPSRKIYSILVVVLCK